jgi:hypothetical protein
MSMLVQPWSADQWSRWWTWQRAGGAPQLKQPPVAGLEAAALGGGGGAHGPADVEDLAVSAQHGGQQVGVTGQAA